MQAEDLIATNHPDQEYLPITGLPEFTKNAAKLAYGADSVPLSQGAVRLSSCPYRAPYTQFTPRLL